MNHHTLDPDHASAGCGHFAGQDNDLVFDRESRQAMVAVCFGCVLSILPYVAVFWLL